MKHAADSFLAVAVMAILGTLLLGKLSACSAQAADQTKAAAYGVQLAACRADAGTDYSNYEQCALGVDARFGVKR